MQQLLKVQDQSDGPLGLQALQKHAWSAYLPAGIMVTCIRLFDAAFREHALLGLLVDL